MAEPPPVAFQNPFDLIYSTGTLHHLPPVDLLAALRGLRARAHPRHCVMVASFHAFTAASCMPRQGGTGYARVRGLTPHTLLAKSTVALVLRLYHSGDPVDVQLP